MSQKPQDDAGLAAGRGVVFIGAAKMYFIAAGAALEFTLSHVVTAAVYGAYGVVAQAVSVVNNVIVQGTIQAVSRATTADPGHADAVKKTGFKMQLMLGLPLAVLFAVLAPVTARIMKDESKAGPLALAACIIAGYSIYAVLVGSANGTRQFHKQAGLDVTFSTMKGVLVVGGALLGLGVYGAIGGWVAAVGGVLMVASLWVGWPRGASAGDVKPMFRFMAGLVAYLILINLIMAADSLLLKRLSTDWFVDHGMKDQASVLADAEVGRYRTVQLLARLPYQLMVAVTFVIFPLMSKATFANDKEMARGYIRTTMRYSLVFAGAMGAVLASNPGPLLGVPFKPEYAAVGGPALAALALGHVAFALFTIGGSILNGAGLTRLAVVSAGVTLVALVAALLIGLPMAEPGKEMLAVAGACTGGAMLLGALATGVLLWREYKVFVPAMTALRVLLAIGAAVGVGRLVPAGGKMITLVGAIAAGVAYLVTLVITRELTRTDLDRVRQVARGRKS